MIKQTTIKLVNVFLKENVITNKQYKRSVFGIEVMLIALAQLSGLLIIALALNLVVELALFMAAFVTLRQVARSSRKIGML